MKVAKEKPEVTPKKTRIVSARTNKKPKLVDLDIMKPHNFMSSTKATMTEMFPMKALGKGRYEVSPEPGAVSIIMKLVLNINQTNPMSLDWSAVLWNITQRDNILPPDVLVTFTRVFERVDDKIAQKRIKGRSWLATLAPRNKKNEKSSNVSIRHDAELSAAIERSDSVVAFGAEVIITAPNDELLTKGMEAVKNYLKSNDETRGLTWELDVNRQLHPFVLYGPNTVAKNKDVFMEMTSDNAAITSMFVDSGGDRTIGSEYIGVSVGKLIQSHAAYDLKNKRALVVGNSSTDKTFTLPGKNMPKHLHDLPSQIYWSQAISRAYLLEGRSVTHFVLDDMKNVDRLMSFGLYDENKISLDVAKGYLNILEVIGKNDWKEHPERITGRFTTHLNNIITLLSQYRDVERASTTDNFASITRTILTDFFVANKYYSNNPLEHLDDIRLIGEHDQYKTLADLGGWIAQRRKSNKDTYVKDALDELNIIINENILPTIPALNVRTNPIIDELVNKPYRVIDLTGMNVGAISLEGDSTTNVMMISYMSLILPTLKNEDCIVIHGFSNVAKIATIIQTMIDNSGLRVDVVFTENNQSKSGKTLELIDEKLDLVVVDLYKNAVDKLEESLEIDKTYATELYHRPGTFYMKTKTGSDYVFLDNIL